MMQWDPKEGREGGQRGWLCPEPPLRQNEDGEHGMWHQEGMEIWRGKCRVWLEQG